MKICIECGGESLMLYHPVCHGCFLKFLEVAMELVEVDGK